MKRKAESLVSITVSVPQDVKRRLDVIAYREDRSVSSAARNLLKWGVYEFERRVEIDPSADITPDLLREAGWLAPLRPPVSERRAVRGKTAGPV